MADYGQPTPSLKNQYSSITFNNYQSVDRGNHAKIREEERMNSEADQNSDITQVLGQNYNYGPGESCQRKKSSIQSNLMTQYSMTDNTLRDGTITPKTTLFHEKTDVLN